MRVKRGTTKNKKHKKTLKQAKGYRLTYSKLYRRAQEALLHAGQYSYAHRKRRKSEKRQEWIRSISAGLSKSNVSYKDFIHQLKESNVSIDRKNLASMAMERPDHFDKVVASVIKK